MGWTDWFNRRSQLELALQRGLAPGGDLVAELDQAEGEVKTAREAEAICDALERIRDGAVPNGTHFRSALHAVTALFQKLENAECDAWPVLSSRGMDLLCDIFDRGRAARDEKATDDLAFVLQPLAIYCTENGVSRVIAAAREGFNAEGYMWSPTFASFTHEHPRVREVFSSLAAPIPQGFIAVALADAANNACLKDESIEHPFDSPAGATRMQQWLRDTSPEKFSYAGTVAIALPFLRKVPREPLLRLALAHPSLDVRIEAAWAAARAGEPSGLEQLQALSLQLNASAKAVRYLEELGAGAKVPAAARDPDFNARAEFAEWLAHPNELARPPDSVEIYARRELLWPPDGEKKTLWLLRYVAGKDNGLDDDDIGVGLVGSITFCLFGTTLDERPPDDGFAVHCVWELEGKELLSFENVKEGATDYDTMLHGSHGMALTDARVVAVAEIDAKLRLGAGLAVAVAATKDGDSGWAVLGLKPARWYRAADMLEKDDGKTILKIDLGRRLLGLPESGDRATWRRPKRVRQPQEIVAAYERQLALFEARALPNRPEELTADAPLRAHFSRYIDSLCALRGGDRGACVIATYERLLAAARETARLTGKADLFDSFSTVGEQFEAYVAALVAVERKADVMTLVKFLEPHWQHNLGYGKLATAAFAAGDHAFAEPYILKIREGLEDWFRSEEMLLLARIRFARGDLAGAREGLIECMAANVAKNRAEADESDHPLYENAFQAARKTFLELFPADVGLLAQRGLPESPLPARRCG